MSKVKNASPSNPLVEEYIAEICKAGCSNDIITWQRLVLNNFVKDWLPEHGYAIVGKEILDCLDKGKDPS